MSKNNDIKKIQLTSPAWEFQRIIEICNEQSKNGYQLEKLKVFGKSIFVKDESKRYIYAVDFNPIILKKEEKEKYIEMFVEQNWEFVDNTFNGFSMFKKEYKDGVPEEEYKIYTDEESASELYFRISSLVRKGLSLMLLGITMMIVGLVILLVSSSEVDELEMAKFAAVFVTTIIICWLPIIIFFVNGLKKLNRKAK